MAKTFIIFLLTLVTNCARAQTGSTTYRGANGNGRWHGEFLSLLVGYNKNKYHYAEVGVAENTNGSVGPHPFSSAYFISTEATFGDKFILAPKIGCWASGGSGAFSMGLNMLYYTNFSQSSIRFRPDIGFGFYNIKIVYGYNITLTNSGFDEVKKSNFSVVYLIGLKKYKSK